MTSNGQTRTHIERIVKIAVVMNKEVRQDGERGHVIGNTYHHKGKVMSDADRKKKKPITQATAKVWV